MSLPPLQVKTEKPHMTLDAFREATKLNQTQSVREFQQVMDAFQNASARLGFGTSNMMEGTSYPFNRITLNYVLLTSLYRGNWIIRKVVDAVVEDMFKNWLNPVIDMDAKKIQKLQQNGFEATGTIAALTKGWKMGRLYGGAVGIPIIKGRDDFERPLHYEEVGLDEYKGMLIFDRWSGVAPGAELINDIDDPLSFGLPEYYMVTTERAKTYKVHHSRVIRFCGPDLPNWEWQANMRWGASVVEAMFEELKKRDNTSWNIASLVFRANVMELNSPTLESMMSGVGASAGAAQRFYAAISSMTQLMSNQGLVVTGKDQRMGNHAYSFGGIADVYIQFMLDICGATEYAMSRLFGRSSSGLSGTNEGDEHAYYERVKQRQATDVNPQLRKLMPIVAMSVWGKYPEDMTWNWNPVNVLPDKERVELASSTTTAVIEAYNAGVISQKTVAQELKEQSSVTGVFTNITDDQIEAADDTVITPLEQATMSLAPDMKEEPEPTSFVGEPKAAKGNIGKPKKKAQDSIASQGPEAASGAAEALERTLDRYEAQTEGKPEARKAGGFDGEKLSHEEVGYEAKATGKDQCQRCTHYEAPGCAIVANPIAPGGWCKRFLKAPPTGTNDAALEYRNLEYQGLRVNIENLRGGVRHGKDWHQYMTAPYGYIQNTEGTDGDEVDCFVGPVLDAPYVYVIHTRNPETKEYDEDKVILGVNSVREAKQLFEENYNRRGFFDSMDKMNIEEFKKKLKTLRGRKIA